MNSGLSMEVDAASPPKWFDHPDDLLNTGVKHVDE